MMTCFVAMIVLAGCKPEDDQWDVSEDCWEVWSQGIVTNIAEVLVKGSTKERIRYTFDNGAIIEMGHIKNPGSVQAGSTGTLYKFTLYNADDDDAWFQWVPDENAAISPQKKTSSLMEVETKEELLSNNTPEPRAFFAVEDGEVKVKTRHDWQGMMPPPPVQQTVLVKFEDGLVTTAYYTRTKEWKAEIDRRKMSGGIALKNIVQWKIVDLE